MYTFTLLDAFFFVIIIMVILVLMAFSFGYTCKMERLTKALKNEIVWTGLLQARLDDVQQDMAMIRLAGNNALGEQARALKRQHREAMKKYKARCDATLAKHISLVDKVMVADAKLPPCTPRHTTNISGF